MESEAFESAHEESLLKKKLSLTLTQFQIIKTIGSGSQGEVYEASNIHFPEKVAIKSIKVPEPSFRTQKILKRIQSEIVINTEILEFDQNLSKYFPQFFGYFEQDQTFYLIFELCSFDVMKIYKKLKSYSQKYTFCWMLLHDMVNSLSLLEKKKIFHRDIKPQNILFNENFFKLIDLGLAKQGYGSKNITIEVGNLFSKAPEVYTGKYDIKSDIWSLGITLYYLLEGKLPYDSKTTQMIMEKDRIQNYVERIRNKQFFINVCSKDSSKDKNLQAFPLHQIMKKMLIVQLEERYLASEINHEFFSPIQLDQINHQNIINEIIEPQKSENSHQLNLFMKHLALKYLEHRETEIGIFYVIALGCIQQVLHVNTKLIKINTFLENNENIKTKKIFLEKQLLKNIKTSCFKLIEVLLKQMEDQSVENKQIFGPITSFGQIQLQIEPSQKIIHQDHHKLQNFLYLLQEGYNQHLLENSEKQNIYLEKRILNKVGSKSDCFNHVLMCISEINIDQEAITFDPQEKSRSKIKSKQKLQFIEKSIKEKLPKSIKYINDEQEFQKGKSNEVLQIFLKFYSKEKLKERFPLLGEMAELLKNLIQSSEDPIKRKIFINSDFKFWNLSLDLFRY